MWQICLKPKTLELHFYGMNYPSKLFEEAVHQLSKFPGIGKKSAARLALFLLKKSENDVMRLAESIIHLRKDIKYCKQCRNISDEDICNICSNPKRDPQIVCMVEDLRDVIAIENTSQFSGQYHVLGALISPMNGVGPEDLPLDLLLERVKTQQINEIVFALSATPEGDTTAFYIARKISAIHTEVKFSSLSRGIAVGGDLEYADEITLGRSIISRIPYK